MPFLLLRRSRKPIRRQRARDRTGDAAQRPLGVLGADRHQLHHARRTRPRRRPHGNRQRSLRHPQRRDPSEVRFGVRDRAGAPAVVRRVQRRLLPQRLLGHRRASLDRRVPPVEPPVMKASSSAFYRCPADGSALMLESVVSGDAIETGTLASAAGKRYSIAHGIPYLVHPETLSPIEQQTQAEYDRVAERIYDTAVDWQFAAFLEDEDAVREGMVDLLRVQPGQRVLEVGCGTGRDSYRIGRRLGPGGALFMQDLSPNMVAACARNMRDRVERGEVECVLEYSVSNVVHLPFADGFFDAVFHFGGLNQFGDIPKAIAELTRVVGPGGRVLVGDEAVAPWLKGTEFEAIVTTNNPLFKADAPLSALPVSARDVTITWVIANSFYVIAFTKGDGPPPL
ncbi:MAG: methyltransferase domain-containing protein, partial [Actinobacteria bacterium]